MNRLILIGRIERGYFIVIAGIYFYIIKNICGDVTLISVYTRREIESASWRRHRFKPKIFSD